jgi:hypothetical protein
MSAKIDRNFECVVVIIRLIFIIRLCGSVPDKIVKLEAIFKHCIVVFCSFCFYTPPVLLFFVNSFFRSDKEIIQTQSEKQQTNTCKQQK